MMPGHSRGVGKQIDNHTPLAMVIWQTDHFQVRFIARTLNNI
jgi:hypothetical protein